MSSISLAVKYRPKTWDDVVEADTIKKILNEQIETNQLKRVLLFTGPAGTGKTTNARIFAREIEPCKANIIEVNCADNTGVEDIRVIIQNAKSKPLQGKYKVFVLDECFIGSTLVKTTHGNKPIQEIKINDKVASFDGFSKVKNITSKKINIKNLIKIKTNNDSIVTTKGHLFFTKEGWVKAQDLRKGDILYDFQTVSKLWKDFSNVRQNFLQYDLLSGVQKEKERGEKEKFLSKKEMCNLWKGISNEVQWKDLFLGMSNQANIHYGKKDNEFRIWDGVKQIIFRKDEKEQSLFQSGSTCQESSNQVTEWNVTRLEREAGWKWKLHSTTDETLHIFREWLDSGVSGQDRCFTKQSNEVSYMLQTGPCLSEFKVGCRGGWQSTSMEKWFAERCQEAEMFGAIRVEDTTCYELGCRSKSRTDRSDDKESYVEMYDLEVEGHPSYFVQNCLVHNCHMLTVQSQNALLKLLEEPPVFDIFIMCTTDPQKVLPTILSRSYRYDFQKITFKGIVDRLNYILEKEKQDPEGCAVQTWDQGAISYIARTANGHLRDAITLLDKCLSYSKNITIDDVVKVLGVTDYDIQFDILDALNSKNEQELTVKLEEVYRSGKDLKLFIKNFLTFVLDVNKYITLRNFEYISIPDMYLSRLNNYNVGHKSYLKYLLAKLLELNSSIRWETNPKTLLESSFLLEVL